MASRLVWQEDAKEYFDLLTGESRRIRHGLARSRGRTRRSGFALVRAAGFDLLDGVASLLQLGQQSIGADHVADSG